MIREIYAKMISNGADTKEINPNIQKELINLQNDMKKQLDKESYKQYRDEICLAVSAAEEEGFVKGFQYAFQLFSECVRESAP